MNKISLISDLDSFYKEETEPYLLYSGTLNPVHSGHIEAIEYGLKELPNAKGVLFIPTNKNKDKSPLPFNVRVDYIQKTILEDFPHLAEKIHVIVDPKYTDQSGSITTFMNEHKETVWRIIGSDKEFLKQKPYNKIINERPTNSFASSSFVRRALDSSNPSDIKNLDNLISRSVWYDINSNGYYEK